MSFYYADSSGTERLGPCDILHLKSQYQDGIIHDMTLVWTEGQGNWQPLKETLVGKMVIFQDTGSKSVDYDDDQDTEQDDENFTLVTAAEEVQTNELLFNDLADELVISPPNSTCQTSSLDMNTDTVSEPAVMKGLLLKVASGLVKNWRNRYFVLDKGVMCYYEPVHLGLRGRYHLEGLQIVDDHLTDSPETIRLYSPSKPDIVLIASSLNRRKRWAAAIAQHIIYADSAAAGVLSSLPAAESSSHPSEARRGTVIEQDASGMAYCVEDAPSSSSGKNVTIGSRSVTTVQTHHLRQQAVGGTILSRSESFYTTEQQRVSCSNNIEFTYESLGQQQYGHGQSTVGRHYSDQQPQQDQHKHGAITVYDNSSTSSDGAPPVCEGWLQKQGNLFPSIRRRYFVLDRGILKYYARGDPHCPADPRCCSVSAHTPTGVVSVTNYDLFEDTSVSIQLVLQPGPLSLCRRKLVLFCEDFTDRDRWVRALHQHIKYKAEEVAAVCRRKGG